MSKIIAICNQKGGKALTTFHGDKLAWLRRRERPLPLPIILYLTVLH